MKQKLSYILCFLVLFCTGCSMQNNPIHEAGNLPSAQFQAVTAKAGLTVAASRTTMYPGETGYITIQGRPGTKYIINTSFKKDNITHYVRQWRTAGADGRATFSWVVSPDTVPGTYSATISGGGETLNLTHTVLKFPVR